MYLQGATATTSTVCPQQPREEDEEVAWYTSIQNKEHHFVSLFGQETQVGGWVGGYHRVDRYIRQDADC